MQKRTRLQFFIISIVIILTVYNILPTVFYYSKPLKEPINAKQAGYVSKEISIRVNELEKDSIKWIESYTKMLKIKPLSIKLDNENPSQIIVSFNKIEDANTFKKHVSKAGNLISFVPSQLNVSSSEMQKTSKSVLLQRNLPIKSLDNIFFEFAMKEENSNLSNLYKKVLFDRTSQIILSTSGVSTSSVYLENILKSPNSIEAKDMVFAICANINSVNSVFSDNPSILNRFFNSFTQNYFDKHKAIETLLSSIDFFKNQLKLEKSNLTKELSDSSNLKDEIQNKIKLLDKNELILISAQSVINKNLNKFTNGKTPFDYNEIYTLLNKKYLTDPKNKLINLNLKDKNPIISQILLDLSNDKLYLSLHKDLIKAKNNLSKDKIDIYEQIIFNEIAKISNQTNENLSFEKNEFSVNLNDLENSKSILVLQLNKIAKLYVDQIQKVIDSTWTRTSEELLSSSFPVYDFETYNKLPQDKKNFCLVIFAPSIHSGKFSKFMRENSIYVIAKGFDRIYQKYKSFPESKDAINFQKDFENLNNILNQNGFLGFLGSNIKSTNEFSNDFIFENNDYFQPILKATRENFKVHGSSKYASLEFTNLEQRILTTNKIDNKIQAELLKSKDDYNLAIVSLDPNKKYDFAPPYKNILLNNFLLSYKKYFRGDDRKILHWGLDLSGGKSVQIELRDQNGKIVKDEASLKQGMNELYNRVNKMGVSEVNIRLIDSNIVLDFPGAQGLSATELVKASSMFFHIVNEKFSPMNHSLSSHINKFLQEVYNEAIVTNKKDIESINNIAYKHLYGDITSDSIQPRSEAAKILYDNGLRLASPLEKEISSNFNDKISKIAILRGNDFKDWNNQTHPLMIVFKNFALDGTSLVNVRSSYDPSKGNFLTFEVKGSYINKDQDKINPRDILYNWTNHFSKDHVSSSSLGEYSMNKGWRMAVVLNDSVISSPNLESALRDSAMISGNFTLGEINQLTSDLKAGSLSYTPHIMSEKNVSPELGKQERIHGIIATAIALFVVILTMCLYYKFAGIVASIAVVMNLLIMWATLQNINATLSLAGIAGIILTVGMAVDANVLIFERIKEELKISNKLSLAIKNGYKKAFSAIFDSNLTTVIAALILLHFDAGPIKGFAITLIIGIASSMFTALFMTKYIFTKWLEKEGQKKLNMSNFVKAKNFNFLKLSKYVAIVSTIIILIGSFTLSKEKKSIFGMDFTGGYSLNVEVKNQSQKDLRYLVEKAFLKSSISKSDFQVRTLSSNNNLRILFGTSMNEMGKPFYEMPLSLDKKNVKYSYENNPRILWAINTLEKSGINLTSHSLEKLDQNWTTMSGQMSDSMRNNAIIGLMVAIICIMIYIAFRFEIKYALSAIICLIHDILVTLSIIAILYLFKVPVQIDLHTIAALMTIIGYSLNDTIVIFDRIREDLKFEKKHSYSLIVNKAINITLSRTTLTSFTTLIALIALVLFGGSTIFNFALVMTIGVFFGTLSSIFIASPLMLFFQKISEKKNFNTKNEIKGL
jgi:SecD/SecF fusion protein